MTYGENFASIRKEQGYTQSKLAERLDVSITTIQNWESGNSLPTIAKLVNLAEIYNISIDRLLMREPSNKKDNNNTDRFKFLELYEYSPYFSLYIEFFEDSWYGGLYTAHIFDTKFPFKMDIGMVLKSDYTFKEFRADIIEHLAHHIDTYLNTMKNVFKENFNPNEYTLLYHELFADGFISIEEQN